jgi:hypothetical protein
MIFEEIVFSSPVVTWLFFIFSYGVLGGAVKYIDDAFDERIYSIRSAILLAPIIGVFWAYLMALSSASATILLAIVLGVLLKGKIDNIAHKIGLVSIIAVVIFSGYFQFLIFPLIILTVAGVIDEVGNDFVDEKNVYNKLLPLSKVVYYFFEYRFTMKLAVFAFVFLGDFAMYYFFAFLGFDLAYAGMMHFSSSLSHKKKFSYTPSNNNSNGLMKRFFDEKGRSADDS